MIDLNAETIWSRGKGLSTAVLMWLCVFCEVVPSCEGYRTGGIVLSSSYSLGINCTASEKNARGLSVQ